MRLDHARPVGHEAAGEGGAERRREDPRGRPGAQQELSQAADPGPRRRLAAICAVAACAAAAGLVAGSRGKGDDEPTRQASRPAGAESRLSLERQVGELLVMSFDGDRMPGYIGRRLARGQGTGVILFGRNAPDRARLGALTRAIQRAARGHALVATDQEGGEIRSCRVRRPGCGTAADHRRGLRATCSRGIGARAALTRGEREPGAGGRRGGHSRVRGGGPRLSRRCRRRERARGVLGYAA